MKASTAQIKETAATPQTATPEVTEVATAVVEPQPQTTEVATVGKDEVALVGLEGIFNDTRMQLPRADVVRGGQDDKIAEHGLGAVIAGNEKLADWEERSQIIPMKVGSKFRNHTKADQDIEVHYWDELEDIPGLNREPGGFHTSYEKKKACGDTPDGKYIEEIWELHAWWRLKPNQMTGFPEIEFPDGNLYLPLHFVWQKPHMGRFCSNIYSLGKFQKIYSKIWDFWTYPKPGSKNPYPSTKAVAVERTSPEMMNFLEGSM